MNTSNTNAHTPGPWEIFPVKEVWRGHDVRGPHGETITHVQRGGSERADEQKANARLIAFAPEVLQALNAALEIMQIVESYYMPDAHNSDPARLREAIRQARLAITKAEGGAQ